MLGRGKIPRRARKKKIEAKSLIFKEKKLAKITKTGQFFLYRKRIKKIT